MASTLEMLIRAKYISQGAGTLESELRTIKRTLTELGKTDLTVNIDKFLPSSGDLSRLQGELAGVVSRLGELREAQGAAFGQGGGGRLAGSVIEKEVKDLEQYRKTLENVINTVTQKGFNISDYLQSNPNMVLSAQDAAAIQDRLKSVRENIELLKGAVAKADLTGSSDKGMLETRLKEAQDDARKLNQIVSVLENTNPTDISNLIVSEDSIAKVRVRVKEMEDQAKRLRDAASVAFSQNEDSIGEGLLKDASKVDALRSSLEKTIPLVDRFVPASGDLSRLQNELSGVVSKLNELREVQQAAFSQGGRSAGESVGKEIKDLEQYRKTLENVINTVTQKGFNISDYLKSNPNMVLSGQDAATIQARLKAVRAEIELLKNTVAKADLTGSADKGMLQARLKEAQAAERELRQISSNLDSIKPPAADQFIISDDAVAKVRSRVKEMETEAKRLRDAAAIAFSQGTSGDSAGEEFLKQASNVESLKRSLEKTVPAIEKTGFSIQNLLTNPLTRLGFGIFALQSSMRTFTELVRGMFDTLLEGASSLDRSRSFEILLTGEGLSPSVMSSKLQAASQGLLTLDEAMAKTIQLTKAGFPEIAKNSDQLLRIATNAAIVSGDISQAGVVYDKLIRGIIRGSPRLIDDADIILKLGDSNEQYAASLGKTVEQLTAAEKVMATYNAVMQEGTRINELADQIDSTSVKVAKMKTEWKEFTEVLKESLAIIVVSGDQTEESVGQTYFAVKSVLDLDVEQRTQLINSLLGSLKGWGVILGGAMLFVKEAIGGVIERMKYFGQVVPISFDLAGKAAEYFGLAIEFAEAKLKGLSRKSAMVKTEMGELSKEMTALGSALTVIMNTPFNQAPGGVFGEDFQKKFDEMLEAAGFIMGEERTGVAPSVPTGETEAASAVNDDLGKILRERAKMSEDIEYERTGKIRDINRDHADKLRDIARKLADTLSDIDSDLANKLSDLAQDRADKLIDIAQDLADKIADIDQDLADKLSDITQDANDKRADAQDEYNQGIRDAEEEHQKKINDILRKYEASRLSALIDRDARALFEAEKTRDEDLADAVDTAEQKKKDELEQLLEKLDDINKAEEQQRADAIASAEQRRRDAQQAADRARRDAQQNYERARRDAQQDAERRRRDARDAAAEERRDALEDQARARDDLIQWYRDKLRDLQQYHQDELQQYSDQYSSINDLTGQFMDGQVEAWNSFTEILRGNREWMGVGSPTDPTTGDTFPDWRNPSNVYVGGRCNRGSSQITTGADGRQYVCIRNAWQLFTGVGGQSSVAAGASMSSFGATGSLSGGLSGGQKIILEVRGDDAMTLIKTGAYEAIVEVME